jgi:uncharacterized protein (TIGR00661 family)
MQKNILVAPLNWGLGHATRCIPIINALIENNFNPILASDGIALELLRKEFPSLKTLELPSYQIEYAKNGKNFKWKMFKNSPKMISAILEEKKIVKKWISEFNLSGIISDNRLGVRSKKVPSVFITHQLKVLTGNTTWLTTSVHKNIIKKFTQCWVPDYSDKPNLTGKLGHLKNSKLNLKYIGPLSRLEKQETELKYDLMVVLSGPEPQRTMLEEILIPETLKFEGNVLFVKGKIENDQKTSQLKNVTYYNFMNSGQIETAFNESNSILCRSGYTTIMDLAKLNKKAFFIPTPGQYEQEYLAKKLKKDGLFPFANQDDFQIENLNEVDLYKGFTSRQNHIDWQILFQVFSQKIIQS